MSNIKQLGLSCVMYADDNEGYFPRRNSPDNITYDDYLAGYDGRDALSSTEMALSALTEAQSSRLYECPSSPFNTKPKRSYAISLWGNGSQAKFRGISGSQPVPRSRAIRQIYDSSGVIALGERGGNDVGYTMGAVGKDIISAHHMNKDLFVNLNYNGEEYHQNKSNYLMVDGHVETRSFLSNFSNVEWSSGF